LTFEYYGMAKMELEAAKRVSSAAGVREHRVVRLPDLRESGDICRSVFGRVPSTYIPMRNCIFYSLAASYAEEVGASCIVGGHNKDDSAVFADAAPAFFKQLERTLWAGSPRLRKWRTRISLPLSGKTKPQVIRLAASLRVPLWLTWCCHRNGSRPCWKCAGCRGRTAAFREAGITDPLSPAQGKFHKQ